MPNKLFPEIRTYGLRVALSRFSDRRHLRTVAYVILALATAIALGQIQQSAAARRHDLAVSTARALVISCNQANQVRSSVVKILVGYQHQTRTAFKTHRITLSEERQGLSNLTADIKTMAPRSCTSLADVVSSPKPKHSPKR